MLVIGSVHSQLINFIKIIRYLLKIQSSGKPIHEFNAETGVSKRAIGSRDNEGYRRILQYK